LGSWADIYRRIGKLFIFHFYSNFRSAPLHGKTAALLFFLLVASIGALRCGVVGRDEFIPLYRYLAFFSDGFRICKERLPF